MLKDLINILLYSMYFLGRSGLIILRVCIALIVFNIGASLFNINANGSVGTFAFLVEILVTVVACVSIHRVILLGVASVPSFGILTWSMRETMFLVYSLCLVVVPSILTMGTYVLFNENGAVAVFVLCLAWWISCRMSLVLPSVAIDKELDLVSAWQLTKGYNVVMVIISAVIPVFFFNIVAFYLSDPEVENSLFELLSSLIVVLFTVMEVILLTSAYKVISEKTHSGL